VVPSIKITRNLPRRGRISGKGENIRRQQPLHINENISTTIAIIGTLMDKLRKCYGNYIQS
jgi:hypothetical protein